MTKKKLTRLQLIAAHIVTNIVEIECSKTSEGYHIASTFALSDSSVVLCWINNTNRKWKQFVTNRGQKIWEAEDLRWKYYLTGVNPAYIESRGGNADNLGDLWSKWPKWLTMKISGLKRVVLTAEFCNDKRWSKYSTRCVEYVQRYQKLRTQSWALNYDTQVAWVQFARCNQ